MADGVGFEPTEGFHLRRFSRPVLSTAQSPIHIKVFYPRLLMMASYYFLKIAIIINSQFFNY